MVGISAWTPGAKWVRKFVGKKAPQRDPNKAEVIYQPTYRMVSWDGLADGHISQECVCNGISDTGAGWHVERRSTGFVFEGRHFPGLMDAETNEVFMAWYNDGGEEIMAKENLIVRPLQYQNEDNPPRPRYGFYLHQHINEMTGQEVEAYRRDGTIPTKFKVGRAI